jgi:endogenous inhibitor of DNA gyrase (YacG/DUF329 family)
VSGEAHCPVCKRPLPEAAGPQAHRPFCSQRCRTIDLGSWLTGAYRISRPVEEEDLDEGVSAGATSASVNVDEDGEDDDQRRRH